MNSLAKILKLVFMNQLNLMEIHKQNANPVRQLIY